MSTAPLRIITPVKTARITDVAAIPPIWDMTDTIEWLIDGMIPRASVNLISAESGTGKTWLAYAIAGAVAHGKTFVDRVVRSTPVVYLDGENPLYVVKRNLADLGITPTENLRVWGGWNDEDPPGPNDDRIILFAADAKPLLIWDSLVEFARCDEQSSTEMRGFMKHFRNLAHHGATVIVLHHTGKSSGSKQYRGSSDIKASIDTGYVVSGETRRGKLHRLRMEPFKSRIAPGQKFAMEFREGRGFIGTDFARQTCHNTDPREIVRTIVAEHPRSNGTQIKDMAKPFGLTKNVVDEVLRSGEYQVEHGKRSALLYTVAKSQDSKFPDPRVEEAGKLKIEPG